MTTTAIEVGYNHRTWITYEVKDATQEEVEALMKDDAAAIQLGAKLEAEGRLIDQGTSTDDNPEIFVDYVEASIISVKQED